MLATNCSGDRSHTSRQSGLPSTRAHRSHTAFTSAAVARWMTPFSGPEPAELAVVGEPPPERGAVGDELLEVAADDQRRELLDRRAAQVVAATDR